MVLHPFLGGIDGWSEVEVCTLARVFLSLKPARPLSFTRVYHSPAEDEEMDDLVADM